MPNVLYNITVVVGKKVKNGRYVMVAVYDVWARLVSFVLFPTEHRLATTKRLYSIKHASWMATLMALIANYL